MFTDVQRAEWKLHGDLLPSMNTRSYLDRAGVPRRSARAAYSSLLAIRAGTRQISHRWTAGLRTLGVRQGSEEGVGNHAQYGRMWRGSSDAPAEAGTKTSSVRDTDGRSVSCDKMRVRRAELARKAAYLMVLPHRDHSRPQAPARATCRVRHTHNSVSGCRGSIGVARREQEPRQTYRGVCPTDGGLASESTKTSSVHDACRTPIS